jgi:hypothetical protein
MRWTTLQQERGQAIYGVHQYLPYLAHQVWVSKTSKRHLVLKYHKALHKYIQTEMDFLDISSLVLLISMLLKSSINLSTRTNESLGLQICNNQSMIKTGPNKQSPENQSKP